jgi:hypothetical protein
MYRKHQTEETKRKISNSLKGRKRPLSVRQNISKGHATNKPSGQFYFTEEYRDKISKANKGRKHSDQTKAKCRAAALKYHHGNAVNPLNEHQVPIMPGRPDWLKDYI